jgi:alanyl-tRNA synthetase
LLADNSTLRKSVEKYQAVATTARLKELVENKTIINSISYVSGIIETDSPEVLKNMAYQVRTSSVSTVIVVGSENNGKANILVAVSDDLVKSKNLSAVTIIKEISGEINGGGGGQPFLATAGGKNPAGIPAAIAKAAEFIRKA